MPTPDASTRLWKRVLAVTAALVIVGGLVLTFTGRGAEMRVPHDATFVVIVPDLRPEIAVQIKAGDPLFTDAGGERVATVKAVEIRPQRLTVRDAAGRLHAVDDPVQMDAEIQISSTARVGDGIVAIGGQVLQAGLSFNVVSSRYKLAGVVVSIDVE